MAIEDQDASDVEDCDVEDENAGDCYPEEPKYIPVTQDNIDLIVDKFHEDLPIDAIITQKKFGMEFKGYRVGWTIDRLNQIIGPHQWNAIIRKQTVDTTDKGAFRVTVLLGIAIGPPKAFNEDMNHMDNETWKTLTVYPVIYKEAYGDSINPSQGDAMKGAFSDALKKALSFIGIGVRAYKGQIGDVMEDIVHLDVPDDSKGDSVPWQT